MSETLTQPLVVPVRQGGSFARRPHEKGNVSIRNCVEGRIDRSGERRVPEPPQKPSANSSGLSRSAALRPAWKNRSRCCGLSLDQPSRVAVTRSMRRICVPLKKRH